MASPSSSLDILTANSNALAPPVVSVAMLTCNHREFLASALDSVFAQEVEFPIEVIIGDDASDDGALEIARDYAERYPGMVRLLSGPRRRGVFANLLDTLEACRGEFVALLEGDDVWCCPHKLARQVTFLREHPDYAGCFHDAWIQSDNVTRERFADLPKTVSKRYSDFNLYASDFHPWDLLARNVIPTASLVYRNQDLADDLRAFRDVDLSLSWLLELLVIRRSKFAYFDEAWATHRNHARSLTKRRPRTDFTRANLQILKRLVAEDCYRHQKTHVYRAQVKELYFLFDQQLAGESTTKLLQTVFQLVCANTMYTWHEARAMLRKIRQRKKVA